MSEFRDKYLISKTTGSDACPLEATEMENECLDFENFIISKNII